MPTNRRCGLVFEKSKTLLPHFACLQSAVRQRLPKKRGPMAAIVHYGRPQSIVNVDQSCQNSRHARHFDGRPRKSRSMEGQRGDRHGPARLLPPRPAVLDLPSPQKKVAFTQPDASPVRGNIAPESPFGLLAATCPCQLRPMPMSPPPDAYLTSATCPSQLRAMPISPPPDAYVTSARCPCQSRAMPISLSPHAYVTLATCLCHFGEMPMSPPATCLCRRSEMPMSPK